MSNVGGLTGPPRGSSDPPGVLTVLFRRRWLWVAILALGLAIRISFVVSAPPRLLWRDGIQYENIGWNLAAQHTWVGNTYYPPLYPLYISAVYSITGRDLKALRISEAILSTATIVVIGVLGALIFTPTAGLIAAGLAAFHPVLAFLPITHYVENLLVLLSALAFGSFVFAVRRPTAARWLLAGALAGLAALCKPTIAVFFPGLALGAWIQLGRSRSPRVRSALLFLVAFLVVISPWAIRNYRVYGRWYLVTTGGGTSFWLGNNPAATGATTVNPEPPAWMIDSLRARGDPLDQEHYFYQVGWAWAREHPGRALRLYLVKMGNLWALYPRTQTRTQYSIPIADLAQGVCSVVVFAGALVGLSQLGAYGVPYLPLAVVSFTLINSVFLLVMRYRMSFEVVLLWLAGLGYASLLDRRRPTGVPGPPGPAA